MIPTSSLTLGHDHNSRSVCMIHHNCKAQPDFMVNLLLDKTVGLNLVPTIRFWGHFWCDFFLFNRALGVQSGMLYHIIMFHVDSRQTNSDANEKPGRHQGPNSVLKYRPGL